MGEPQNKIVSIDAFRASRPVDRTTSAFNRGPAAAGARLSPRNIEHRERMLRYLRMEAAERAQRKVRLERHDGQEVQGSLLL